jgi:hypothetical protein
MSELLLRMHPDSLIGILVVTLMFGLPIVASLAYFISQGIRRYHERHLAATLIMEMLERGMSADDVVRVLSAAGLENREEGPPLGGAAGRAKGPAVSPGVQSPTPTADV